MVLGVLATFEDLQVARRTTETGGDALGNAARVVRTRGGGASRAQHCPTDERHAAVLHLESLRRWRAVMVGTMAGDGVAAHLAQHVRAAGAAPRRAAAAAWAPRFGMWHVEVGESDIHNFVRCDIANSRLLQVGPHKNYSCLLRRFRAL